MTRGWRGVGLVAGWQATASLCFYVVFPATAFVRDAFGLSRALTGLTVTAAIVGYTLLLFPMGAVVDAFGERSTMVLGLVGLALATAAAAVAPSYLLLLAALVLLGGVYAVAMPASNRAALAVAPPAHRNLAMNVKQVGVTAGSGGAAIVVTVAATRFSGYGDGFLVAAAVAVVVAVAFALWYPARDAGDSLSLPSLDGLLERTGYRALLAAGFFLGAAVFSTTAYVVLHLTESVGLAAAAAGGVLAAVQVTGSAGRILAGIVADRLPGPDGRANGRVLLVQALLAAVCFVAVALARSELVAAGAFAVLGTFILGFPGTFYACMTALVPEDRVGAATAGGQTALNLGGLAAPPAFGLLADVASYGVAWTTLAGLTVVAAVLLVPVARGLE